MSVIEIQQKLTKKQKRALRLKGELPSNSGLSLKTVTPLTLNQSRAMDQFRRGKDLFLHGTAGTGKTFVGMYLALDVVLNFSGYNQVIVIRSTVPCRDIGFLPGSKAEKVKQYATPYMDICSKLFNRADAYGILEQKNILSFEPTSFLRGNTFEKSIVIADEIQNMNWDELSTIMTRIGDSSRLILSGDTKQSSLKERDGKNDIHKLINVCQDMNRFCFVQMEIRDIVRGSFVRDFIVACEKFNY